MTCYAFAAAQLGDYWIHSHAKNPDVVKHETSAAVLFAETIGVTWYGEKSVGLRKQVSSGGETSRALTQLTSAGSCDRRVLDQLVWACGLDGKSKACSDLKVIDQVVNALDPPRGGRCNGKLNLDSNRENFDFLPNIDHFLAALGELAQGSKKMNGGEQEKALLRLMELICPPQNRYRISAEVKSVGFSDENQPRMIENLKEVLRKKEIPIAVGICSGVFLGVPGSDAVKNCTSSHALVLVGRERNSKTGKCEYILRDSYGNCQIKYHPEARCSQGNVWIPEDIFARSLVDFQYLE